MAAKDYKYCPKCGYKKLTRKYDYQHGYYVWTCEHGQQSTYRRYHRRHHKRSTDEEKPKKVLVPCDCEIRADGRDAEIADFGTVLDQINRAQDPEIKTFLLENEPTVQRRGLEVLYEGETIDVVRARFGRSPEVYMFFKQCWKDGNRRKYESLTSRPAQHIKFRGYPVKELFARSLGRVGTYVLLWNKEGYGHGVSNPPFSGSLGKKKIKEIVDWALALEAETPRLLEEAKAESKRWHNEHLALRHSVHDVLRWVDVHDYNGHTRTACINIRLWLTPDQVRAIAEIVKKEE